MNELPDFDETTRTAIEAEAFRKLVAHLQQHPEVQNIDLMNLGYFCRNCISKWYRSAAESRGIALDYDQAREIVYGMPYGDYKARYQEQATPDQLERFKTSATKATT